MEEPQSLTEMVGTLTGEVVMLFRKEVLLAKVEIGERLDVLLGAARNLALGSALAVGAIGVLLAALVSGLAAVLIQLGADPAIAGTIAAIVVAAIFGGIAWALIASAIKAMRQASLNLDRTLNALAEDAAALAEKFE